MIINGQDVGKQLITCNGKWVATKNYKRLCIVYKDGNSYLSKCAVPAGTPVDNEDYWQKFFETDAALKIDLTNYKAQLQEQVQILKEAVTSLVNTTNENVDTKVAEMLAKVNELEGNLNSHLNNVLVSTTEAINKVNAEQNSIKSAVSAVSKKTDDNAADAKATVSTSIISLQGVLTKEIERLETKIDSVPKTTEVSVQSVIPPVEDGRGATRLIVETDADRETFTTDDIKVGYEVYVIETGLTYVLTEIVLGTNVKTWKLEYHSTIGACYFDKIEDGSDEITVDRAIADEEGINFREGYVRKSDIAAYVDELFRTKFVDNMPLILAGSITPDMLSESTKDLIGNKTICNLADGFTIEKHAKDGTIGLANHEVNVNNFRSYGHKHLGYNITDGHNILEQSMVEDDYTIYHVYLDYDLNGATIELPEHAILIWMGGYFDNGTIKSNGVVIDEKFKGTNLIVE